MSKPTGFLTDGPDTKQETFTQAPPSPEMVKEFRAINNMVAKAHKEGLLAEVVFEFGHKMTGNGGLVLRSCSEALYEWDIP